MASTTGYPCWTSAMPCPQAQSLQYVGITLLYQIRLCTPSATGRCQSHLPLIILTTVPIKLRLQPSPSAWHRTVHPTASCIPCLQQQEVLSPRVQCLQSPSSTSCVHTVPQPMSTLQNETPLRTRLLIASLFGEERRANKRQDTASKAEQENTR